ncbi:MAG: EthD family reductase [Phycisphaerae bacterium]|nr:EthD family reductase [Phycisphaerae bacterium]
MVKLVALYKKPEDAADFDRQYFETHVPLAMKMPGLVRCEVARVTGSPMGESPFHLIAELYFQDMASLSAAMASAEGKAAAKNLMGFAGKVVSMHFAEVVE